MLKFSGALTVKFGPLSEDSQPQEESSRITLTCVGVLVEITRDFEAGAFEPIWYEKSSELGVALMLKLWPNVDQEITKVRTTARNIPRRGARLGSERAT
jgi:hypothetical protein